MLSISMIEELIPITKSFSIEITGMIYVNALHQDFMIIDDEDWFYSLIYPLFLQEVIEGINEKMERGWIMQTPYSVQVAAGESFYFRYNKSNSESYIGGPLWCKTVIEAKEKAILYVMEDKK